MEEKIWFFEQGIAPYLSNFTVLQNIKIQLTFETLFIERRLSCLKKKNTKMTTSTSKSSEQEVKMLDLY